MKRAWQHEREVLYGEVDDLRGQVDYMKGLNINVLESDDEYFEKYNIQKPKPHQQLQALI